MRLTELKISLAVKRLVSKKFKIVTSKILDKDVIVLSTVCPKNLALNPFYFWKTTEMISNQASSYKHEQIFWHLIVQSKYDNKNITYNTASFMARGLDDAIGILKM